MPGSPHKPIHPTFEETVASSDDLGSLEKALEIAHVGRWVAELDGSNRLSWSAETHRIFGVPLGEFPGTSEAFFALVHPDDVAAVRAASQNAKEGHQPYDVEHRIVEAGGRIRWVRERADVIRTPDGRARMVGSVQDITEERALKEHLRNAQKMEAIGRLAGGVTHDLNNALTAVVGYTELALSGLAQDHPAYADVSEIRHAAERATSVARQLLAFSRKQVLHLGPFDLNEIVHGLVGLLTRTLGHNITLRTELGPHVPQIAGDAGQMEQAIVNLAVNACDAMPHGGDLAIATSVEEVDESFARVHPPMRPGRFVVLSVADTGHGLDAETRAQIFEPFFTTKGIGRGTGLGLAMVRGTVKQSGGYIFVESEVGHGATFRLYFPPVRDDERPSPRFLFESARPSGIRTVLVVEDEPSILNLVTAALKPDGYRLLSAASGPEALDLAASYEGSIDLLLTDAMMPGMTGLELADQLLVTRPGLGVIVMSGYTLGSLDVHVPDRVILALQKPFTPKELRTTVRRALGTVEA